MKLYNSCRLACELFVKRLQPLKMRMYICRACGTRPEKNTNKINKSERDAVRRKIKGRTLSCACAMKVAVVGAGVIGLSAAYCLAERFRDAGVSVTVIAEKFSPNTTSDKAGAFTQPAVGYPKTTECDARSQQWTLDTFKHFSSLYHTETAAEIELSLVSGYKFVDCSTEPPPWKDFNLGFRCIPADSPEVQALIQTPTSHSKFSVWAFSTYLVDCRFYLPWLMAGFIYKEGRSGGTKAVEELG